MKVSIHQPDLMPWAGFFIKIVKCDLFIVLDHVENNPRDAAFWGRRVKILSGRGVTWLSLPLKKDGYEKRLGIPINEIEYNVLLEDRFEQARSLLINSYRNHPFFDQVWDDIDSFFKSDKRFLGTRNMDLIRLLMERLDINPKIIRSSELRAEGKGSQLLVNLMSAVGGTTYVSGVGAKAYMDEKLFERAGIVIEYNSFTHPNYVQYGSRLLIEGLSLVDMAMNIGYNKTSRLLKSYRSDYVAE